MKIELFAMIKLVPCGYVMQNVLDVFGEEKNQRRKFRYYIQFLLLSSSFG